MVLVTFQPDDDERARAIVAAVQSEEIYRLRNCFSRCPVRFQVAGRDLHATHAGPLMLAASWMTLPLLDRASGSLAAIDEAWAGETVDDDPLEWGNPIIWQRVGDRIVLASPFGVWRDGPDGPRMPVATATFAARNAAIRRFGADVRAWILTALPELRDHPEAGAWFRGEVEVPEFSWTRCHTP